ncbi:MAG: HAMP domain-containing sensor histidine kinase [Cellvibrionales bacterium]|nr:HAMP domain-containing sensor histidine kinase [Cellvibrionales bacterium]
MDNIDSNNNRSLVVFYCYFRVILATLLFVIAVIDNSIGIPGEFDSTYFASVSLLYLLLSSFQSVTSFQRKFDVPSSWLLFSIGYDILTTLVLIHISGGVINGFAILLITPICIAAIFFHGSLATGFAAIASLGLLGISVFYDAIINDNNNHIVPAGMFGIIFFAASLCVQYLSEKIRSAQSKADSFQEKATIMAELNQHIVQRIRTGVIIFDKDNQAILYNKAAESLLTPLSDSIHSCEALINLLNLWRKRPETNHNLIKVKENGTDIKVNFSSLDKQHVITFIEDMTEVSQQALQMKLASLGRLSASIAHEIRNPLNAISHSVQLLEESPSIENDDKYLINIAQNHCKRINEIVSNIQSMSQRRGYKPEKIELISFCEQIKHDYLINRQGIDFLISSDEETLHAPFDPTQLRQILTNLIDNAIRYSFKKANKHWVNIQLRFNAQLQSATLAVYDLGDGVPPNAREKLFEPFFTSESTGTGLGLYISRELCTLNQSYLTYSAGEKSHAFEIQFAHANRDIVVKNPPQETESLALG